MRQTKILFAALALLLFGSIDAAAQTRKVQGYETDASRPNLRSPREYDLSQLSTGNGSVSAATKAAGVAVTEAGIGAIHQTSLTLTAVSVTMTDATTAGSHGSILLYDFPAGAIHLLGATYDLTTLAGAGGIGDTAALVGSIGTVTMATDNATLTSTEADVIPSTAGTLTGGAGTLKSQTTTALSTILDGTTTAKDAWLNLAVPDAGSSANDTVTVAGTVTVFWINLGDY